MSRQTDREQFLYQMSGLSVPISVARKILRHAATIQRCNEAFCSYEWADRDRVECPGVKDGTEDCICDYHVNLASGLDEHETVPRVARTAKRRKNAILAILAPFNLEPVFQNDPRGLCVRILRPTDRRGESYSDGIGVPA